MNIIKTIILTTNMYHRSGCSPPLQHKQQRKKGRKKKKKKEKQEWVVGSFFYIIYSHSETSSSIFFSTLTVCIFCNDKVSTVASVKLFSSSSLGLQARTPMCHLVPTCPFVLTAHCQPHCQQSTVHALLR